jgi:hypothetical protein
MPGFRVGLNLVVLLSESALSRKDRPLSIFLKLSKRHGSFLHSHSIGILQFHYVVRLLLW